MSRSKRSRSRGAGARIEARFRFVLMRVPDRRRSGSSEVVVESTGTSWSQWIKAIAVRRLRIPVTVQGSKTADIDDLVSQHDSIDARQNVGVPRVERHGPELFGCLTYKSRRRRMPRRGAALGRYVH